MGVLLASDSQCHDHKLDLTDLTSYDLAALNRLELQSKINGLIYAMICDID